MATKQMENMPALNRRAAALRSLPTMGPHPVQGRQDGVATGPAVSLDRPPVDVADGWLLLLQILPCTKHNTALSPDWPETSYYSSTLAGGQDAPRVGADPAVSCHATGMCGSEKACQPLNDSRTRHPSCPFLENHARTAALEVVAVCNPFLPTPSRDPKPYANTHCRLQESSDGATRALRVQKLTRMRPKFKKNAVYSKAAVSKVRTGTLEHREQVLSCFRQHADSHNRGTIAVIPRD